MQRNIEKYRYDVIRLKAYFSLVILSGLIISNITHMLTTCFSSPSFLPSCLQPSNQQFFFGYTLDMYKMGMNGGWVTP